MVRRIPPGTQMSTFTNAAPSRRRRTRLYAICRVLLEPVCIVYKFVPFQDEPHDGRKSEETLILDTLICPSAIHAQHRKLPPRSLLAPGESHSSSRAVVIH